MVETVAMTIVSVFSTNMPKDSFDINWHLSQFHENPTVGDIILKAVHERFGQTSYCSSSCGGGGSTSNTSTSCSSSKYSSSILNWPKEVKTPPVFSHSLNTKIVIFVLP